MFRAYDPDQDRLVAVKLFRLNLTPELVHKVVAGFERLVAADLGHPAIATPLASGTVEVAPYLAQDFVAADSLDTVVREFGASTATDAARVATHLAGALDFAAAVGVFHGSLHPRDVLLAGDDARLTGLGVAQVLESVAVTAPVRRPYAAPERAAGRTWDRRADIYSLAVLVAEMMSGRKPSSVASLDSLFGSFAGDAAALRQVFAKAMADEPAERFDTALAFADALKQVVEGAAATTAVAVAPPVDTSEPALRPTRSRATELSPPDLLIPRLPLDEPMLGPAVALLPGDEPPFSRADAADDELTLPLTSRAGDPAVFSGDWTIRGEAGAEPPHEDTLPLIAASASTGTTATTAATRAGNGRAADVSLDELSAADSAATASDGAKNGTVLPPVPAPAGPARSVTPPPPSSVWPIPLALMVGLIVGIAVGFFIFGSRPLEGETELAVSTVTAPATAAAPASATATAPSSGAQAGGAPVANVAPAGAPVVDGSIVPPVAVATTKPAPVADLPASVTPATTATAAPTARTATPAARPRDTRDGRIVVRTSPAGARVVINGKDAGVTPVTLRALAYGTHALRLTREGYVSEERRVTVNAGQPAPSLVVRLSRERRQPPASQSATTPAPASPRSYRATLVVESRPVGAAVFLDGTRIGTTPLTMDSVPTGSHAVRLELEGYRRWSSSVRVAAGERNRVTASLEQ